MTTLLRIGCPAFFTNAVYARMQVAARGATGRMETCGWLRELGGCGACVYVVTFNIVASLLCSGMYPFLGPWHRWLHCNAPTCAPPPWCPGEHIYLFSTSRRLHQQAHLAHIPAWLATVLSPCYLSVQQVCLGLTPTQQHQVRFHPHDFSAMSCTLHDTYLHGADPFLTRASIVAWQLQAVSWAKQGQVRRWSRLCGRAMEPQANQMSGAFAGLARRPENMNSNAEK
jgi:hypothetical protein